MTTPHNQDADLLSAAIRINTILMALIFGLMLGLLTLFSTWILVARGGSLVGKHLSLFSIFMPGYSVTPEGAWIGLVWGTVYGAVFGVVVYRAYAPALRRALLDHSGEQAVFNTNDTDAGFRAPIAQLSGHSLGVGLGLLASLQLIGMTNWLVIRGSAENSLHAELLHNFLPGYSVTTVGSFIGGIELALLVYIACRLLALIYNSAAQSRRDKK
jgi:hypothetical protein